MGCFPPPLHPAAPDDEALDRANLFVSLAQKLVTEARQNRKEAEHAEATALDLVVEARRLIGIVSDTRGGALPRLHYESLGLEPSVLSRSSA